MTKEPWLGWEYSPLHRPKVWHTPALLHKHLQELGDSRDLNNAEPEGPGWACPTPKLCHREMLDREAGGGDAWDTSMLALPCTLVCSGNPADREGCSGRARWILGAECT